MNRYTYDLGMDGREDGLDRCVMSPRSVTFRLACAVITGISVATGTFVGLIAI